MSKEHEFLKWAYHEIFRYLGPASGDVKIDLLVRYEAETGNNVPVGYRDRLNEMEADEEENNDSY